MPSLWSAPGTAADAISPHFKLSEFARSGSHPSLVSQVPRELHVNVLALCMWGLEPLREALSTPLEILSGYRSAALNKAVGGSPTSQHTLAQAADVTYASYTGMLEAMFELVNSRQVMGLGQIICYPSRRFMHMALRSSRYPFPMVFVHEPALGLHYMQLPAVSLAALDAAQATARTLNAGKGGANANS